MRELVLLIKGLILFIERLILSIKKLIFKFTRLFSINFIPFLLNSIILNSIYLIST